MTRWPQGNKPENTEAFAQYAIDLKPEMIAAAASDREAGHQAIPAIMELVDVDGRLTYEVMDSPRCDHTCPKCREDIYEESQEFGRGAIGVFNDSSGGEMERLRRELRQLAQTINNALPDLRRVRELGESLEAKQLEAGKEK